MFQQITNLHKQFDSKNSTIEQIEKQINSCQYDESPLKFMQAQNQP